MDSASMLQLRDRLRILEELGDKVLNAFGWAVVAARRDLAEYRAWHPDWVAQSSSRGLANWIHDRLWHHVARLLIDIPEVEVYEKGATRELIIGGRYRVRVKRHGIGASVSTYPTQGALEFMHQPNEQLVLAGLEQVRLIFGYEWLGGSDEVGAAVLSLRDGSKKVLWVHGLPDDEQDAAASLPSWEAPAPGVMRQPQIGERDDRRRSTRP